MKTSACLRLACALAVSLVAAGAAWAQPKFPSKPITLVVPFSAGSGTDQVARAMAQALPESLPGATVVIDNKPGANGFIAAQAVTRAAPDGYTLLMTTNTTQSANPHLFKKLPYDPVGGFEPIAALGRGSMVLVVPAASAYHTVEDLLAAGRQRELNYGAGNSSSRVGSEMLGQMTGTKVRYAPYKSNPQALTDLLGGQFDFMLSDTPTAAPMVKAGKLRALAYAGATRAATLPNVPTLQEAGVKGYELYYWIGVYAPHGTPRDVVERLNQALVAEVRSASVTAVYEATAVEAFTTTPGGLADFQRSETEKWGRVIRTAGIEPE